MKPGGGRSKGHNFERWVAIQCRTIWPEAKRGLQGRGGAEAPDVDVPEWWIECKVGGPAKDPVAALEQAEGDAAKSKDGRIPVAICKRDRCEPTATMRLEHVATRVGWGGATPITMSFADWLWLARRF